MSDKLPSSADEALLQMGRALRDTGYSFTTTTPATHARVNARPGNEWANDLRDVFGWSRPFHTDILPSYLWELMRHAEVLAAYNNGWRSRVRFSTLSEQLFAHSAFPTTNADDVFFGPDTYRFALALKHFWEHERAPFGRIADIGCGAGPGAILYAQHQPQARVFGLDINDLALRYTRINAALANTSNVEAHHSDLLGGVDGNFDLIVSNPPYLVDPGERAYRHGGGPLGAELSLAIVRAALGRLAPGGTLLLYTGVAMVEGDDPFRHAVAQILEGANAVWNYREMDPDVFGEELETGVYAIADRIAAVVLTCRKTA
jgi:methylase of polypeptide subunit release factors